MSLTSLGIASRGLLDRGASPALSIAVRGLLRVAAVVPSSDTAGGGGGRGRRTRRARIITRQEQIERAKARKLAAEQYVQPVEIERDTESAKAIERERARIARQISADIERIRIEQTQAAIAQAAQAETERREAQQMADDAAAILLLIA